MIIILGVYFLYFTGNKNIVEIKSKVNENNFIKNEDDLITEMKYFSEDNKGNKYEIESDYGVINPDQTNLIKMSEVKATVYLSNGEKIFIRSKQAEYNNDNSDTTFSGSVKMNYGNNKITAENLELSFRSNFVTLYKDVNYDNGISNLIADKVIIDLVKKNTKILMNDKNKNILVRSKL
tara:strand:+ start:1793 stop:2329 length:537 start_codon:yes stop_codon:yes gene_type:complete